MRRRYYRFKRFKQINGIRGVISLFLAVLMTPFLTIAMGLVEAGRYNSAVSILDEAMGISSTAVLANYDPYLHKRWGLLAVSQEYDIDTLYNQYLDTNSSVLGTSLNLEDVCAEGEYALTDGAILEAQILEYTELNGPVYLAANGLNVSDLVKKFEKIGNLDCIFSMISSGTDAVDAMVKLEAASEDLKQYADNLDNLKTTYSEKYTNFSTTVNALIDAKNETRPDEETDQEGADEYDENIATLTSQASTAKSEYCDVLDDIADNYANYKTKMETCEDAIISIQNDIAGAVQTMAQLETRTTEVKADLDGINKSISEMEAANVSESDTSYQRALDYRIALETEMQDIKLQEGMAKAAKEGLSDANADWQQAFSAYSSATLGEISNGFQALKTKVNNFSIDGVNGSSSKIDSGYYNVEINGYISAADIDSYIQEQSAKLTEGSLVALLKGLMSFLDAIMNLDLFFKPELSGNIDIEYYNSQFGGLPGDQIAASMIQTNTGLMGIINRIATLQESVKNFWSHISWSALKNIFSEIKELFQEIVNFLTSILQRLYEMMTFSTYAVGNLPCRTDYEGFQCMNGYSLESESLPQASVAAHIPVIGSLSALVDEITACVNASGSDITFYGAELEYILFGSTSEMANQLYTFCAIYFLRLLLDIPIICTDTEVELLATASTFGYPLVMALEILLEPLADTVILVNGGQLDVIKSFVYLTPTGLPKLVEELASMVVLSNAQKDSLKSGLTEAFGTTSDGYDYQQALYNYEHGGGSDRVSLDPAKPTAVQKAWGDYTKGLVKLNYRDYCYLLMAISVSKEQQLARLGNLIQMETLYYYRQKGADYTFDLRNSYTYLHTEADVRVEQMLPALIDSSLFEITREQYRGY